MLAYRYVIPKAFLMLYGWALKKIQLLLQINEINEIKNEDS